MGAFKELSARVNNALVNNDIMTKEQLMSLTPSEYAELKGLGAKGREEIYQAFGYGQESPTINRLKKSAEKQSVATLIKTIEVLSEVLERKTNA